MTRPVTTTKAVATRAIFMRAGRLGPRIEETVRSLTLGREKTDLRTTVLLSRLVRLSFVVAMTGASLVCKVRP